MGGGEPAPPQHPPRPFAGRPLRPPSLRSASIGVLAGSLTRTTGLRLPGRPQTPGLILYSVLIWVNVASGNAWEGNPNPNLGKRGQR